MRLNLDDLVQDGPLLPDKEILVGIFEHTARRPVFNFVAQKAPRTLQLSFKDHKTVPPGWTRWVIEPPLKMEPTPPSGEEQALSQWRKAAAFLHGLLQQHAPSLFDEFRVASLEDRIEGWKDKPTQDGSPRFFSSGDFNGDKKKDYAFILPGGSGQYFGLFALVSAGGVDYRLHRLSRAEGPPQRFGLEALPPGTHTTAAVPPLQAADPPVQVPAGTTHRLRFSGRGQASSIFYWDLPAGRFYEAVEQP
jgi:hypothetical protein